MLRQLPSLSMNEQFNQKCVFCSKCLNLSKDTLNWILSLMTREKIIDMETVLGSFFFLVGLRGYCFNKCWYTLKVWNVYLVRYSVRCLFGLVTLVDDIADLLAVHNEVNAICGQRQEWVMDMVQLRRRKRKVYNRTQNKKEKHILNWTTAKKKS